MHDSRVTRQDSYVMKTLSILAMVFLPISTVSSIFGTQFFTTSTSPDPTSSTSAVITSFVINKKIWWLWAISIPVTIVMLVGWGVWIKRSQLKVKRLTYWMKDVEKAKSAWETSIFPHWAENSSRILIDYVIVEDQNRPEQIHFLVCCCSRHVQCNLLLDG